ncbi:MAG: sulfotransferase family protein [Actinomycetes bacterium]
MDAAPGQSDAPIFIVGCPRSGTTLLQLMLHAHPRIAVPPETRFVIPAYRMRRRFGRLTKPANRRKLATWIVARRGSKDLGLDPERLVDRVEAAAPTIGSVIGTVFAMYAEDHGRARWGDKRPGYWRDIDVLARMFPDAQFIHLLRDGRSCVASLKRMPWWVGGVPAATAVWLMSQRQCRRDAGRLPPGRFHELRYEDLVVDPEAELRRLCAFLGEEFAPAMLQPHEVAKDSLPAYKMRKWHTRTGEAVDTSTVESWRDGLEPEELGLVELVAGRRLRKNGYVLSGAGRRPSLRTVVTFTREYGDRVVKLRRLRAEDARLRRREARPLAARPAPAPGPGLEKAE